MIKQNKGKDLDKIAKSKLVDGPYYMSKKYDGHYVQLKYERTTNTVQMWTSGGKEFYLYELADYIKSRSTASFHIECEFSYNCRGKLGDRGKSAILTTYRTNFEKGIPTPGDPERDIFRVLDIVDASVTFETRLRMLQDHFQLAEWFTVPTQLYVNTIQEAQELTQSWVKLGWEGSMLKSPKHIYQPGKRTNDIIKLKPRKTADLLCIGWEYGEADGKYHDCIGRLVLQDSKGRQCKAGSGLSDTERELSNADDFIGQVIEVEYERIDETYVQPIYKGVRNDKTSSDID